MSSDQNSYNKVGMFTFVLSMVVSLALMVYVSFFSGGIDLKEVKESAPGVGQTIAAGIETAKEIDVSKVKEPWVSADEMIVRGKQVYGTACAMCHGNEGKGNGPAGMSLNPKPRDFVEGAWKKGGNRLGLFEAISNGMPPSSMVGFKHLPVNDRWALVHYIRSITKNKAKDDDKQVAAKAAALQ